MTGATWGSWILSNNRDGGLTLEVSARSMPSMSFNIMLDPFDFHWVKVLGEASSQSSRSSAGDPSTKSLILDCLGRSASPEAPMTNKQIAAKISKPLATVKRVIGSLVGEGLLDFRFEGNRKLYYCSTYRATNVLSVQDGSDQLSDQITPTGDPISDPMGDPMDNLDISGVQAIGSLDQLSDHPPIPTSDPITDPINLSNTR